MFVAMLFLISKSVPIFNLVPAKGRKNIRNRELVATESEIHGSELRLMTIQVRETMRVVRNIHRMSERLWFQNFIAHVNCLFNKVWAKVAVHGGFTHWFSSLTSVPLQLLLSETTVILGTTLDLTLDIVVLSVRWRIHFCTVRVWLKAIS